MVYFMSNKIEVEVKAKISDMSSCENHLLSKGAVFKEEKYQHDILLDPPSIDFSKSDQVLRIRNSNGSWKLDYKSPRLDNETKSRMEYSIKIDDGSQLKDIFNWMNFKLVGEIEKTRRTYELNDMVICFDNVTNLGEFIEVEIMSDEADFESSKIKIMSLLKELGISETIRKDYLELLWDKGFFKN
ncbi:MAG: adenylate cyclase, class 2 [archaeon GW2011_AR18]|nr:MAG: adenylate cyclase, class 2 [archaeon GW2011_AR18]